MYITSFRFSYSRRELHFPLVMRPINGTPFTIATVYSRTTPPPPRYSSTLSPNYTSSHQPLPRPLAAAPTAGCVPRSAECVSNPDRLTRSKHTLQSWRQTRACQIGRECLRVWIYTRVDDVIWVKTNQVCLFPVFFSITEHVVTAPARRSHRQNRPLAQFIQKNTC